MADVSPDPSRIDTSVPHSARVWNYLLGGEDNYDVVRRYNQGSTANPYTPRSPEQITRFFDGLELLEPGVVSMSRWRPTPSPSGEPPEVPGAGGLGRKPSTP